MQTCSERAVLVAQEATCLSRGGQMFMRRRVLGCVFTHPKRNQRHVRPIIYEGKFASLVLLTLYMVVSRHFQFCLRDRGLGLGLIRLTAVAVAFNFTNKKTEQNKKRACDRRVWL